jgi:hypothetical protein
MRSHWKLAAGMLASAGLAAIPASASATGAGTAIAKSPFTITAASPFAACYDSPIASFPISLTGGTPGDIYGMELDRGTQPIASGDGAETGFDSSGNGSVTLTHVSGDFPPAEPIAGVPVTAVVHDYPVDGSPDFSTTIGTFDLSQLGLTFSKTPISPSLARNFAFSGAFPNSVDYGFIVNNAGTRVLRKFAIGRSNNCGYVRGRNIIAPPGAARGTYRFYVYPGPHLVERGTPFNRFKIYLRSR